MTSESNQEPPASAPGPLAGRDPSRVTPFYRLCRSTFNAVAAVAFDLRCYGIERVPREGGVLIAANHQSYLDPPLLTLRLNRPAAFLAKSELFDFKPFGYAIRRLNAFPVRQGAGDVSAMKASIEALRAGWLLTIFPEGSRTPDGALHPAQKGTGLLVRRAGVPVVPAVIDGAYDAWPRNGPKLPRLRPIRVLYGEPEDWSRDKPDDIRRKLDDGWARMLDDLRSGRV